MCFFQTIQNLFKIINHEIFLITLDRKVTNDYKYMHILLYRKMTQMDKHLLKCECYCYILKILFIKHYINVICIKTE